MAEKVFDHVGWFGIVPIYASGVETSNPILISRYKGMEWTVSAMATVFQFIGRVMDKIDPYTERGFPIHVKKIDKPFSLDIRGTE